MPRAPKPIPDAGTPQAHPKRNATTWQKGQSGNPNGNAKSPEARAWLHERSVANLEAIMEIAKNSEKEETRLRAREFLLRLTIAPPAPEQTQGELAPAMTALLALLAGRLPQQTEV